MSTSRAEEIAGRTAAAFLKSNTADLLNEVGAMRAAVQDGNLDACVEHDINFHQGILKASQNDVVVRVWDTLAFDLRIRAVIGKISSEMREVVEFRTSPLSKPFIKGRGRESRSSVEKSCRDVLRIHKKSESDSSFHKALRRDLEGAKGCAASVFPTTKPLDSVPVLAEDFLQSRS